MWCACGPITARGKKRISFTRWPRPNMRGPRSLNYLKKINRIRNRPEWYNALTNNCTTNIATLAGEPQLDWRVLLNGRADQMLYERGDLATGNLPFRPAQAAGAYQHGGPGGE